MRRISVRLGGVVRIAGLRGSRPLARLPEETASATQPSHSGGGGGGSPSSDAPAAPIAGTNGNGQERSSNATRRRVIEAGARVFADLGFHAATKERIGAAAGFSHQTVRDYFRTKEGLLAAIVADAWRTVLGAVQAHANAAPLEQLMAGYDALATLARERPAEARCVLHEAQIAGARGGPLLVDEERAFKQAVERLVTTATRTNGAGASARAEAVVAAMTGLARPQVIAVDGNGAGRYTAAEARESFRAIAASVLQPLS